MRNVMKHIATLLSLGVAAVVIAAAPVAAADEPVTPDRPSPPSQSCAQMAGSEFKCDSPGNVQLNDGPPVTKFFPQGDD